MKDFNDTSLSQFAEIKLFPKGERFRDLGNNLIKGMQCRVVVPKKDAEIFDIARSPVQTQGAVSPAFPGPDPEAMGFGHVDFWRQ